MKTAIFVYEAAHVAALPNLLKKLQPSEEYDIIACGADIEFLLEEKGFTFCSTRDMRISSVSQRYILVQEIVRKILKGSEFSFFSYRNISLGKLFAPALFYYLVYFLYYFDIAISALDPQTYDKALVYYTPTNAGPATGVLADLNGTALPDAVRLVCTERNIALELVPASMHQVRFAKKLTHPLFVCKRAVFGFSLHVLNAYVRLRVSKKEIKILASELWKNIEPLMQELPESELVLLDRTEAFSIGWRGIMRNRMQFMHSGDFLNGAMRKKAHHASLSYKSQWESAMSKHDVLKHITFRGYSLERILEQAIESIFASSEKVLRDIEGTWAMMQKLQPDVVIVRAGISAQTHFAVLCEVARLQVIPSLEIQHGMLSVAPESETKDRTAAYIAEYGPLDRKLWREYGNAPNSELEDIGSPRFDVYKDVQRADKKEQSGDGFVILHIAPEMNVAGFSDSYDVYDYFENIAAAARKVPNAQVIIKLRGGHANESFYREAIRKTFQGLPYTITMFAPLVELFPKADCVVSSYSTVLLEALLAQRPVIFDASLPIYTSVAKYDLAPHRDADALVVTKTREELIKALGELAGSPQKRQEMSAKAEKFMQENYLFHDGKSSERLANTIKEIVTKK